MKCLFCKSIHAKMIVDYNYPDPLFQVYCKICEARGPYKESYGEALQAFNIWRDLPANSDKPILIKTKYGEKKTGYCYELGEGRQCFRDDGEGWEIEDVIAWIDLEDL